VVFQTNYYEIELSKISRDVISVMSSLWRHRKTSPN